MDIGKKKVSFPMVANYDSVVRYFVECGLDAQFIMPPKMTRRTLEIGTFKYDNNTEDILTYHSGTGK